MKKETSPALNENSSFLKELTVLSEGYSFKGRKTADQLEVGDAVEITGNVQFQDSTGEIVAFGQDKKFVIVDLYNHGKHSFHSSDVHDIEENEDEDEPDFYVAFYDEDEGESWIGRVTQEDGKWRERTHKGKPDYRWGTSYMSYLTTDQVMRWIRKDYSYGMRVDGPFDSAEEAEDFVKNNFGMMEEVEQVDEISAELKQSYLDKATTKHLQQFLGRAPVRGKQELDKRRAAIQKTSKELTGKTHYQDVAEEEADSADSATSEFPTLKGFHDLLEGEKHGLVSKSGDFSLTCDGKQFTLHNKSKKLAKFSHSDWLDLVDAVKNRTTGSFGGYRLKQKGDSYTIEHSSGAEIAYMSATDMDKLAADSREYLKLTEETVYTDFNDWKKAVLNSYPAQAKKIKFKGRMEGNKTTISAEIPGEDRSYGVWDGDDNEGVVLSESARHAETCDYRFGGKCDCGLEQEDDYED